MHHDTPLISTIVAGLVLAYIFGMIANRVKLPPLVGYLFAGILVGPYTPGFVADQKLGAELAELGVILLMFGVGLHFSLKDLMSVRALAIPGAIAQIAVATLLGAGLGLALGWELGGSLLFGLALSVASTVVLLKALQDRRLIETERGRIAVGWLIVEDLAMVLALVLVPAIAALNGVDTGVHDPFVSFVERMFNAPVGIWGVLAITLVKVAAFVGFMLVVGRRIIPWALHLTAHTGSRELFRLAVLAIALGVALGSAVLFGVSLALGAFFAGMILSESELSHRAANETLPLRDAFAVLFFVSVGMLFDPSIILTDPLPVLATVFIIVIGKSLAAFGIVLLFRRPVGTALTISASLAQIGEFSFILASMGVALTVMPAEAQSLILAGALISIVLNPVIFWAVEVIRPGLETRYGGRVAAAGDTRIEPGDIAAASQGPATTDMPSEAAVDRGALGADDDLVEPITLKGHSVLVGYGQVGRIVAEGLKEAGHAIVVIEDSDHDVATARASELEVIYGNAARQDTLRLANLAEARNLVVAISNAFEAGTVVESGRKLNPGISIIARAYSEEEEAFLRNLGATTVIRGEREIGKGILSLLKDEAPAVPDEQLDDGVRLPPADNVVAQAASAIIAAAPIVAVASAEEEIEPVSVVIETLPVVEAVADLELDDAPVAAVTDEVVVPVAEPVEIAPPVDDAEPAVDRAVAEEPAAEAAPSEVDQGSEVDTAPAKPDDVIILPPPAAEPSAEVDDVAPEAEVKISTDEVDEVGPGEVAEAPPAGDAGVDAGEEKIDSEDDQDNDPPAADGVPVVKPEPRE